MIVIVQRRDRTEPERFIEDAACVTVSGMGYVRIHRDGEECESLEAADWTVSVVPP